MTRAIQVFVVLTVLLAAWQIARRFGVNFTPFRDDVRPVAIANIDNPGEPTDISRYRVHGRITAIEFYSAHCASCRNMDKIMRALISRRPEIVLRIVDIDRPRSGGIDFKSPLAIQYGITTLPTFIVYDRSGMKLPGGSAIVSKWITEEFGPPRRR